MEPTLCNIAYIFRFDRQAMWIAKKILKQAYNLDILSSKPCCLISIVDSDIQGC